MTELGVNHLANDEDVEPVHDFETERRLWFKPNKLRRLMYKQGKCLNCLTEGHRVADCQEATQCCPGKGGGKHHWSLCLNKD